jgi:hypothetical protein
MKILKMKFGESGDDVDAYGIRFFGDFEKGAYRLGRLSEMISSHDTTPLTESKRVTLWFTFQSIRPYKSVSSLLDKLTIRLKSEGYKIAISSLEYLADTTSPEYENRPEGKFPVSDRMHGYNAAGGFSVTAEKTGKVTQFSMKEVETIHKLAMVEAQVIYGRILKAVDRQS